MECKKSDKIIDMECKPEEVYKLFKKKSLWKKDLIQEKTGYCWLIAVLNCISVYMKKKNIDANYTFSVRNLIIYDKLEKANFFLEQVYETRNEPINSRSVIYVLANAMTDKGNWRMAVNLIEKYGLLPVDDVDKCQIMRTANLNAIVSYLLKSYAYVIREKYKEMTYAEFNTLKEEVISEVRNIIFSYWGEPINSVTLYDGIGNRIYLTQLEFYYKNLLNF
ncbi:C1 family peptidase [Agathobacter rectalis]|uniref:C1 family peptidase n=1 Tax=Agathobacter rectalis TaxID=39491 RepID=UPI001313E5AC|nr:C1 family peptidase [Agathobacter rectalis]